MLAPRMILMMEILGMSLSELEHRLDKEMKACPLLRRMGEDHCIDLPDRVDEIDRLELRIIQGEDGKLNVKFRNFLSGLCIDEEYMNQLEASQATVEGKEKTDWKIRTTKWLLEAIDRRQKTMLHVAQEVVDSQNGFMLGDLEQPEHLKMQSVADALNIAVTTVSRAVNGKTIGTPRGTFPLRDFFVRDIDSTASATQREAIMLEVKKLIDREDKARPYSDSEIVKVLADREIKVARRTITKCRELLEIPSSVRRRERG